MDSHIYISIFFKNITLLYMIFEREAWVHVVIPLNTPGPYYPGGLPGDKACWKRYFEQIHDSEGFDIKDYPGSGPMTTIFPMPNYLKHPEHMEKMKGFAGRAIEHYNEKMGTSYEVNEILKVNGHGNQHFMYYITLSVKNGENKYFQVKVVDGLHLYNSLDFPIVRPRAKEGLDI